MLPQCDDAGSGSGAGNGCRSAQAQAQPASRYTEGAPGSRDEDAAGHGRAIPGATVNEASREGSFRSSQASTDERKRVREAAAREGMEVVEAMRRQEASALLLYQVRGV